MIAENISNDLKIPDFQPKTKLDEYLKSDGDIQIYQDLKRLCDQASILEYFNNLYREFFIIIENKEKPVEIISHFKRLDLDKEDLFFVLNDLVIVITYSDEYVQEFNRKQLNIILDLIVDESFELGEELFPDKFGDGVFRNFRKLQSYTNSNEDPQEQLRRMISIKYSLEQLAVLDNSDLVNNRLIRLIDFEITKLVAYCKQIPAKIEPNISQSADNELIFDKTILNNFHSAFNGKLWENEVSETFLNWFKKVPIGKPVFIKDMKRYFCYAVSKIKNHLNPKNKPVNFGKWHSLVCSHLKFVG